MAIAFNIRLRLSCLLQGLLYFIYPYLITNSVKHSRAADFSYEQYNVDLEIAYLYVVSKLHIASKLILDSAHSVATMAAH